MKLNLVVITVDGTDYLANASSTHNVISEAAMIPDGVAVTVRMVDDYIKLRNLGKLTVLEISNATFSKRELDLEEKAYVDLACRLFVQAEKIAVKGLVNKCFDGLLGKM